MLVRQILSEKGSSAVETVKSGVTIAEACKILSGKRIGALIVSADGERVDGVLSERDIVRELGKVGADCLSRKVGDMMTADVIGCTPGETAVSVLQRMTAGRFRHMPVLEDGKLAGVISIGDVVKARMSEIEMENTALADMIRGA